MSCASFITIFFGISAFNVTNLSLRSFQVFNLKQRRTTIKYKTNLLGCVCLTNTPTFTLLFIFIILGSWDANKINNQHRLTYILHVKFVINHFSHALSAFLCWLSFSSTSIMPKQYKGLIVEWIIWFFFHLVLNTSESPHPDRLATVSVSLELRHRLHWPFVFASWILYSWGRWILFTYGLNKSSSGRNLSPFITMSPRFSRGGIRGLFCVSMGFANAEQTKHMLLYFSWFIAYALDSRLILNCLEFVSELQPQLRQSSLET